MPLYFFNIINFQAIIINKILFYSISDDIQNLFKLLHLIFVKYFRDYLQLFALNNKLINKN